MNGIQMMTREMVWFQRVHLFKKNTGDINISGDSLIGASMNFPKLDIHTFSFGMSQFNVTIYWNCQKYTVYMRISHEIASTWDFPVKIPRPQHTQCGSVYN